MSGESFIAGGRIAGEPAALPCVLRVEGGAIAAWLAALPAGLAHGDARVLDARGLFLAPMLIDAHVHLAFAAGAHLRGASALQAVARALLAGGVAGALDLGMPEALLPALPSLLPLHVRSSGPLFTAPLGYPTQSWGRDGYGLALSTAQEAREAVARLADAGAHAIKLALDRRFPVLAPEVARAAADAAHARSLRVFAHALDAESVRAALDAGADVLAHTPAEALPEALVREAGARGLCVLSTAHAFGAGAPLLENLARLHAAGARVVYGTDLGNEQTAPGASLPELLALSRAGLSPAQIFRAATLEAAALLEAPALGHLRTGARASLLGLREDPLQDATALARPAFVVVDGARW